MYSVIFYYVQCVVKKFFKHLHFDNVNFLKKDAKVVHVQFHKKKLITIRQCRKIVVQLIFITKTFNLFRKKDL